MPVIQTSSYSTLIFILPEVLKCLNDLPDTFTPGTSNTGRLWGIPPTGQLTPGVGFVNLIPSMQLSYRKIQANLANIGATRFKADNVDLVVPAVAQIDPSVQVEINEATAPPNNLPSDLLSPTKIWERQNLTANDFQIMNDMTEKGGLPSEPQGSALRMWEWRDDSLCFIGATIDTQIRLRYVKQLPELVDASSQMLIRNARSSFVYFTAALELAPRGSPLAERYDSAGNDALEVIMNRETRKAQSTPVRRRPFSSRSWQGPGGY